MLQITDGKYKTEKQKICFLYKFLPSFFFNLFMMSVVFDSSKKAKSGKYDDNEWIKASYRVLKLLEKVGIEFEIEGVENFRELNSACVFIGNHMSTLETFILPVIIHPFKKVTFVVKKELVEVPVFKHIMKSREPVVVGREKPREDLIRVLEEGGKKLRKGISVIIFPQTTRKAEFIESEFNSIGIKLAKKAGVPVIPLALKTDSWANGKIIKDIGRIYPKLKVYFKFGEKIDVISKGAEEHKKVIDFISANLEKWNAGIK